MQLSHITLSGFKSFAKKTTVDITHNVTGIVGPNGSGKSNIAEAIRFVLGEQSMKSMRTKLSTDLLYKGGSHVSPASKAEVTLALDNHDKNLISVGEEESLASFLVYDEILLSRVLYGDGTSEYTINGAKVRLKDVHELLALAGIGSTSHLIVSQGEADKVLLASPKERKTMLEDALGLRIYHIRLNESERKLLRVKEYMREVDLLKKEISPQLSFLEKEVKKLDKVEGEKHELARLYNIYSYFEKKEVRDLEKKIEDHGDPRALRIILQSIEKEMSANSHEATGAESFFNKKKLLQEEARKIQIEKGELSRLIGRLEAEKIFFENESQKEVSEENNLTIEDAPNIRKKLHSLLGEASEHLNAGDYISTISKIELIRKEIDRIFVSGNKDRQKYEESLEKLSKLKAELEEYEHKDKAHQVRLNEIALALEKIEEELIARQAKEIENERKKRELIVKHAELKAKLRDQEIFEESLKNKKEALNLLEKECMILAGRAIHEMNEKPENDSYDRAAVLKSLERLKLRIEDAGLSNGDELRKEYETLRSREEYLSKELADVTESEAKLISLIDELNQHIEEKFTKGIEAVSREFNVMFGEMFTNGKASVKLITETDEEGMEESGIDISISLPEKRIKGIFALSGGEKALTSMALSFAMSEISRPPFMVLDETDAALDEINAKKYGRLLTRLSKNSKLLVITHNRETMSHCDMLYGVTIGADGTSKLLSISFGSAENYVR